MLRLFDKRFLLDVKAKYFFETNKCRAWRQNGVGLETKREAER